MNGQSDFAEPQGADGSVRREDRRLVVGTLHNALHPRHSSWLNLAEIGISLFARHCLGQRRIPSLRELQRDAREWDRRMNRDRIAIDWLFTRTKHSEVRLRQKQHHTVRNLALRTGCRYCMIPR